jgi:hypothetical protein
MTKATSKRSMTYEDIATTREACESIIECNPHHISLLPTRFVDNGLRVLALRLGARPEEIPA